MNEENEKFIVYKLKENEKIGKKIIVNELCNFIESMKYIYLLECDKKIKKFSIKYTKRISKYETEIYIDEKLTIEDKKISNEVELLSLGLKNGECICSDYSGSMTLDEFRNYLHKVHNINYKDANGITLKLLLSGNSKEIKHDLMISFNVKGIILKSAIVGTMIVKLIYDMYRTGCIDYNNYIDIISIVLYVCDTINNFNNVNSEKKENNEMRLKILELEHELRDYSRSIKALEQNCIEIINKIKDKLSK